MKPAVGVASFGVTLDWGIIGTALQSVEAPWLKDAAGWPKMKSLLSLEVLVSVVFILVWSGVALFIAYPLADKSLVRSLLMIAMSLLAMIYGVVKTSPTLRLLYQKLRYRLLGPTYQVRAGGTFRATMSENDSALLKVGLDTARKVFVTAKAESTLANRMLILGANSRTIKFDLPQEFDETDADGLGDALADEDTRVSRLVEVELWGYEANSTRVADLVEREIVPFFDNLGDNMRAETKGRNFWLQITLPGRNPFLQFYLRDVPDADVSLFQLEFTRNMAGDQAKVGIRKEGFSISAFSPRPFVRLVRDYLSTPALAHSDRD